jgi:hypothetical protein
MSDYQLSSAAASMMLAEARLRDVEAELERLRNAITNLDYYAWTIEALPTRVEWDTVRDTLRQVAKGDTDA